MGRWRASNFDGHNTVSRLMRDGIRAQGINAVAVLPTKSRFALLPMRDEVINSEHIHDLMDQDGI